MAESTSSSIAIPTEGLVPSGKSDASDMGDKSEGVVAPKNVPPPVLVPHAPFNQPGGKYVDLVDRNIVIEKHRKDATSAILENVAGGVKKKKEMARTIEAKYREEYNRFHSQFIETHKPSIDVDLKPATKMPPKKPIQIQEEPVIAVPKDTMPPLVPSGTKPKKRVKEIEPESADEADDESSSSESEDEEVVVKKRPKKTIVPVKYKAAYKKVKETEKEAKIQELVYRQLESILGPARSEPRAPKKAAPAPQEEEYDQYAHNPPPIFGEKRKSRRL